MDDALLRPGGGETSGCGNEAHPDGTRRVDAPGGPA